MPEAMPGARLAVVVLHYGDVAHTRRCIESLYATNTSHAAIILVDNGTRDSELSGLETCYPALRMIHLPENRGWAGGCNAGVRVALADGSQAVCLLNNDTVVPGGADALAGLGARFLETGPCLLQPRISYMDEVKGEQIDPASWPWAKVVSEGFYELNFAYGACLLVHAEIFTRIGLFDERFFLQLEETDFYQRAVKQGYKSYCDTSVLIRHVESAGFGHHMTPLKCYYITRNTLLLLEKHRMVGKAGLHRLKGLFWLLWSEQPGAVADKKMTGFLKWAMLGRGGAAGFRAGLKDYFLRRFGRGPKSLESMRGASGQSD
ncbi:glycosyltransferase family 2 protein [Acidihalobacter ferrooxydans]|uniref:Glycosyltransferase 2-like domain-containing protein n=1 Tax=Acidihalobacter ferrooxydans TaxID=1765967 RepID=A0A1P8UI14_9GAMM|nr:glycosyltransferase family 2 protein [Acidihalobacter ferrooxydans]APZ43476.1 hypothetical protein BW247_10565 [Acidihalobacter ferrooxydans]